MLESSLSFLLFMTNIYQGYSDLFRSLQQGPWIGNCLSHAREPKFVQLVILSFSLLFSSRQFRQVFQEEVNFNTGKL
jgi:hypothetical protein